MNEKKETCFAVFLRGINVGGHTTMKMAELRSLFQRIGFTAVQTYKTSGNIVLCSEKDSMTVTQIIRTSLGSAYGIPVPVVVKTIDSLQKIIHLDPFKDRPDLNHALKMAVMLSAIPGRENVMQMNQDGNIREEYYLADDIVYVYYHEGSGRSYFTNTYIEKRLNLAATSRNWNTILAIDSIMEHTINTVS